MRVIHAVLLAASLLLAALGGPLGASDEPYAVTSAGPLGLGHLVRPGPSGPTFHGFALDVAGGRLQPRTGDAVIIVEPVRGYAPEEVRALRTFLEDGGLTLLLGKSGALEELLLRLDAGLSLGATVFAPGFYRNKDFPIAQGFGGAWVLTQPRTVHGGSPLLTLPLSWEDLDGDGGPGLAEPMGVLPVAASAKVGRGELFVVGTASPLTLDGWGAGPGPPLLALIESHGVQRVLVDEAHRAPLDPLGIGGLLAGASLAWVLPGALVLLAGLWALRPRLRRKAEVTATHGLLREVDT